MFYRSIRLKLFENKILNVLKKGSTKFLYMTENFKTHQATQPSTPIEV